MSAALNVVPLPRPEFACRITMRVFRDLKAVLEKNPLEMSIFEWITALNDPAKLPELLAAASRLPVDQALDLLDSKAELENAQREFLRALMRFEGCADTEIDRRMAGLKADGDPLRNLLILSGVEDGELDAKMAQIRAGVQNPTTAIVQ